jgi:Heterokaryon incompatibility protein (HET)
MRTIYKQARDVVVWLGEEGNNSAQAMRLLKVLAKSVADGTDRNLGDTLQETPDFLGHASWRALCQLMERPYWDRLWIMQEIPMGGEHTPILCGKDTVSWSELYHGTYTFGTYNVNIMFTLIEHECHDAGIPTSGLKRNKIIHLWTEQNVQAGREKPQVMCMLDLGRKSLATEPRDRVYGVLGVMPAAVAEKNKPNYNSSIAELYTSFTEAMISTSKHVFKNQETYIYYCATSLLCHAGKQLEILEQCTWHSSSMPSWVPDWNNTNHFRLFSGRSATLDRKASFQVDSKAALLSCLSLIIGEVDGLGASYYESYYSSDLEDT